MTLIEVECPLCHDTYHHSDDSKDEYFWSFSEHFGNKHKMREIVEYLAKENEIK